MIGKKNRIIPHAVRFTGPACVLLAIVAAVLVYAWPTDAQASADLGPSGSLTMVDSSNQLELASLTDGMEYPDGTREGRVSRASESPPETPTDVAVYSTTMGSLDVRWSSEDFLATDNYKVQWKSGDQEFDDSRQRVADPTTALVLTSSTETKRRYRAGIVNLVDGTEYTVRVIASNEHGDSGPSSEETGTPSVSPGQARSFFRNELIDVRGDSHPWLRQTWSYLTDRDAAFIFVRGMRSLARFVCQNSPDIHECYASSIEVSRPRGNGSVATITHELAHVFTIATGAAAKTAPVAIGFLYFEEMARKLKSQGASSICTSEELYADALTMVVHPEESSSSRYYWSQCVDEDTDHTEEALTVARSVVAGEMPSWFADTYHDEANEPDLEALWSDVLRVSGVNPLSVSVNLRDAFGGYCYEDIALWRGNLFSNPWRGDDDVCPPHFEHPSFRFSMVDDAAVGAPVGSVSAIDAEDDILTYSIIDASADDRYGFSDGNGKFAIDGSTGAITVAAALDYDSGSRYMLKVQADDNGNGGTGTAAVRINVWDADPRPPVFTSRRSGLPVSEQSVNISENAALGLRITDVKATDPNRDRLTYTITAGNDEGKFAIETYGDQLNGYAGEITLVGALDYETTSYYSMTVQADDGNGGTDTMTVTVTVFDVSEDGAPVFSHSTQRHRRSLRIIDSAELGSLVRRVQANDPNGYTLTYAITAGNEDGKFAIDGSTGAITVAGALDYETTPTYFLDVQANNGNGGTATITLKISVTDVDANVAPQFGSSTYHFSIAENSDTGAAVGTVSATDADNDPLTYAIEAGNGDGKFAMSSSGAITTAGTLDHETTPSYTLTVQADDGNGGTDTATVTVTVTDVAESTSGPLTGFTLVDASGQSVLATLTAGSSVALADPSVGSYALRADVDANATIGSVSLALSGTKTVSRTENIAPYSLYGDGGANALSGQSLPVGSYTLTATAYSERQLGGDDLDTLAVSFTVTQANRAPEFGSSTYNFSIAEDAATGDAVGTVSATDADSDGIAYTIEAGNGDGKFAIDGSSGAITTAGELDHETTASYTLTVQADDGTGGTDTATVNVTVTDVDENSAPEFGSSTYNFSVAEDAATGAAVGTVSATDADSDGITYSITAGNGDGKFAIDGSSGAITTAGALDHETTPSYTLTVQADDGNGGTDTATVNVTVTDVDESTPGPLSGFTLVDASDQSVLATLTAGSSVALADPSGGSYAVRADVDPNATIGSVSLALSGTKTVSRTENIAPYSLYGDGGANALSGQSLPVGSYTLTATAYSERQLGGDQLGTLAVSFTVTQANRAPEFGGSTYSFSIAEDATTGASVGTVSATDADSDGIAYTIEAGNGDGKFALSGSGAITVAGALDHETTPSYTLTVKADDGNGGTDTATVNISVTDVVEDPDGARDGAVSLGDQSPSKGRQFFRNKSLDRAGGDTVDYYTFTTDARYTLGLGVRDQTINLDCWLEDADGNTVIQSGPPVDPSKDQTIEWLKTTINAGTYYIRVQAMEDGQTDYYLRFGLTAPEE